MKNYKTTKLRSTIKLLIPMLLLMFASSCRKNQFEANQKLTKENGLTSLSRSLGVNAISIIESDENTDTYNIDGKVKVINDTKVDLNATKLEIEENDSFINLSLIIPHTFVYTYKIDKKSRKTFKINRNNSVQIETILSNKKEETIFAIAMVLFNDIMNNKKIMLTKTSINNQDEKNIAKAYNNPTRYTFASNEDLMEAPSCERTIISIRTTQSRATTNVSSATDKFIKSNPDCKRVYGVESGCLWGSYVCVASQSIKCSGGGCNVPLGDLGSPLIDEPDSLDLPVDTLRSPLPVI